MMRQKSITAIIITVIVSLLLLSVILLGVNGKSGKEFFLNDILFSDEVPIEDLTQGTFQDKPVTEKELPDDLPAKVTADSTGTEFYIIVGSFNQLSQARRKTADMNMEYKMVFIMLPPTKDGKYRISCGKYPTEEEAKAVIEDIRKKVNRDAWIMQVKQ